MLGDRMEMGHSIEGRVPFLDHKVVEVITRQPVNQKIRGMTEKYVLREAVKDVITDTVYKRQKHPFLSPPATLNTNGEPHIHAGHAAGRGHARSAVLRSEIGNGAPGSVVGPGYGDESGERSVSDIYDQLVRAAGAVWAVGQRGSRETATSVCFFDVWFGDCEVSTGRRHWRNDTVHRTRLSVGEQLLRIVQLKTRDEFLPTS
jgi:hypothetical protein